MSFSGGSVRSTVHISSISFESSSSTKQPGMIRILISLCMASASFGFGAIPFLNNRLHRRTVKILSLSVNGMEHAEVPSSISSDESPMAITDENNTSNTHSTTTTYRYGAEKRLILSQEGTAISADQLKVGNVEKFSPPVTFKKYLTMQEKRVNVKIRYSNVQGMRPFYLTVATLIKSRHGDVVLEKELLPVVGEESEEEPVFEIIIDGKTVPSRNNYQPVTANDRKNLANGLSVFIPMEEVNAAIAKARRRRRPTTTVYAQSVEADDGKTSVRLEMKKRGRYKK